MFWLLKVMVVKWVICEVWLVCCVVRVNKDLGSGLFEINIVLVVNVLCFCFIIICFICCVSVVNVKIEVMIKVSVIVTGYNCLWWILFKF